MFSLYLHTSVHKHIRICRKLYKNIYRNASVFFCCYYREWKTNVWNKNICSQTTGVDTIVQKYRKIHIQSEVTTYVSVSINCYYYYFKFAMINKQFFHTTGYPQVLHVYGICNMWNIKTDTIVVALASKGYIFYSSLVLLHCKFYLEAFMDIFCRSTRFYMNNLYQKNPFRDITGSGKR